MNQIYIHRMLIQLARVQRTCEQQVPLRPFPPWLHDGCNVASSTCVLAQSKQLYLKSLYTSTITHIQAGQIHRRQYTNQAPKRELALSTYISNLRLWNSACLEITLEWSHN
jgi:hypothetical protein